MAAAAVAFVFLATGFLFLSGRQEQGVSFEEPLIEVTELYIMGDEVCASMDDFYQAFEQWGLAGSIRGEITSVEEQERAQKLQSTTRRHRLPRAFTSRDFAQRVRM